MSPSSFPPVRPPVEHPCRPGPRPARLGILLATVVCVVGTLMPRIAAEPAGAAVTPRRPNVVLMLADDLGWGELGCYGQAKIRTPHLDRLAAEGMRFTQHYSGAPVCAPSRCVLLSGRHAGHAEIRGNRQVRGPDGKPGEGQHPITDGVVTLAEVFRQAGYVTGAMGKWGLGPPDSSGAPQRQGFDLFFGYNCQAVAHSYYPSHLWRNEERIPLNATPVPGHARQPDGPVRLEDWTGAHYAPDRMLDEAVDFLQTHRDRPFFLYLPFIEPHVALQPPADLVASYPEAWDDRPYRGQCSYTPHPRPRAAYAALITSLDRRVGRILATLETLGLTRNTLVTFTSDNGTTHTAGGDPVFGVGGVDGAFFASTGGLRGRKGSVYEGGLRVPLIVRWPGRVQPGTTSAFPSYFPDHFPTLCEAAGLPLPPDLDGLSLLPILTGQGTPTARPPMVWVFPEYGGQVAVRLDGMKALRRDLARPSGPAAWEVYDLDRDPGESVDLAAERPEVIRRAEAVLRREMSPNPIFPVSLPGGTGQADVPRPPPGARP